MSDCDYSVPPPTGWLESDNYRNRRVSSSETTVRPPPPPLDPRTAYLDAAALRRRPHLANKETT